MKNELIQIPDIEKTPEFITFCKWSAQPRDVRLPIEQKDFAKEQKVDEATLCRWKQLSEFAHNKRQYIREWLGDDLPEVMQVVKKYALRGSSKHIDTFLKWLGELSEGNTYVDARTQVNNYNIQDMEEEAVMFLEGKGYEVIKKGQR